MKQVSIGHLALSKVICGSNPFYGHSHFSSARDAAYKQQFDDATIEGLIKHGLELGINAVESSANERIVNILAGLRKATKSPLNFIGSTRLDETSELKRHEDKLAFLIQHRAPICIIHAQYLERQGARGEIKGLDKLVDSIHAAGLYAGVSCHRVATVELCELKKYGIDVYMFPLNPAGFVYPGYAGKETAEERINLVRGIAKPFILMKTLAAGRLPPSESLPFAFANSKPGDILNLGFGSLAEMDECVGIINQLETK
jgi:hypothetical protein